MRKRKLIEQIHCRVEILFESVLKRNLQTKLMMMLVRNISVFKASLYYTENSVFFKKKNIKISKLNIRDDCEPLFGFWESNTGSLEGQSVFLPLRPLFGLVVMFL